uniref:Uncharacterized protein n=1 Tax=Euglena archaeoplastidiata TaxID=1188008 RepID=A0A1X9GCK5_9EUGL|nr:hypothetical protein [Euglena archaeoplastidiata]AKR17869.1 hypothetical protein [Euglena archaeoplastidiata]
MNKIMMKNTQNENTISQLYENAMKQNIDVIAPNFRRKTKISEEQIKKIIKSISLNLDISEEKAVIGMTLLFLQGAASASTPTSIFVELGDEKYMEKRNIIDACALVTGHRFIRRIAETLALQIGNFAYKNKLIGELGYRVNNKFKAETGESLTELELAYCSSFSQTIPNLSELVSDRLVKLLAEDYQKRFENKRKSNNENNKLNGNSSFKKKKNN